MSLVNNMLIDLQSRHAIFSVEKGSAIEDLRASEDLAGPQKSRPLLIILLPLLLIVLYLGYLSSSIDISRFFHKYQNILTANPEGVVLEEDGMENSKSGIAYDESPADDVSITTHSQFLTLKLDGLNMDSYRPALSSMSVSDQKESADTRGLQDYGGIDIKGVDLEQHAGESVINIRLTSYPEYNAYVLDNPDRLMVEVKNLTANGSIEKTEYADEVIKRMRPAYKADLGILVFDLNRISVLKEVVIEEINADEFSMKLVVAPSGYVAEKMEEVVNSPRSSAPTKIKNNNIIRKISKKPDSGGNDYMESINAYKAGDITQAIDLLYGLVTRQPHHIEAITTLVAILAEQGDRHGAKKLLAEGLKTAGNNITFIKLYARMLYEEGKTSESLELLNRISPDIANEPDYYAMKAAMLQQKENYREANDIYGRLVGLNPDNSTWWAGYGITLEALGNQQEALQIYKRIHNDTSVAPDITAYINQRLSLIN